MAIESHKAVLVLADIGGYTRFIKFHDLALVHAETIITDLLESVIDSSEHPLTLNKLEGDAALFYALADKDPEAVVRSALAQTAGFFSVFAARRAKIIGETVCKCSACQGVEQLRIKAILHFGEVALKQVRKFEEIAGQAVIVAHRLLKNCVTKDQYVLVTEAVERLAPAALGVSGAQMTEDCEGIGRVNTVVYDPPRQPLPIPVRAGRAAQLARLARMQFHAFGKRFGLGGDRSYPKLSGL
jgi:class 3 adenylate cyclase